MITIDDLKKFKPKFNFFIGLDSDGTVFDSMNYKHNNCFIGPLIKVFNLIDIEDDVINVWKHINLYSKKRGINRFEALFHFFEVLKKTNKEKIKNFYFPNLNLLNNWTKSGQLLTDNFLLQSLVNLEDDEKNEIKRVIFWSEEVNKNVKSMAVDLPLISNALNSIKFLSKYADIIVISNTPSKTLNREWRQKNLHSNVSLICGQETGSKYNVLKAVTRGKYDNSKVLMIGDSPSDLIAAKKNNVLFFPIIPLKEEDSWSFFISKAASSFFSLQYQDTIQEKKILEFKSSLNANF